MSRRVPTPHWESPKGHCRWCGKPVLHLAGKKAGEHNLRRHWHDPCLSEYKIAAWPKEARRALAKRDKGRCCDCGEIAKKWLTRNRRPRQKKGDIVGPYTQVKYVRAFEVDHEIPLWSVARLAEAERVKYFLLDNLRTRCPACHKAKTAHEAIKRKATTTQAKKRSERGVPKRTSPIDATAAESAT